MAKTVSPSSEKSKVESIIDDYNNDLGAMELTHLALDEKEKILLSQPIDQITQEEVASKVSDPTLLSAVLKQNNAVMAQMPSGKITALTQKNKGKSLFMDLIFHNHVLPHATSQYDAYTKLWLLSFYRKVYGSFGVLVDFVENKGYIGPDFTLLPIRSIIPQSGKTQIDDMDYTWVRNRVSKSWLKARDTKVWKNIDKVLETKGDSLGSMNSQSFVERENGGRMVIKDEYEIITRFEGDRWRTFHAATNVELRDISNPQKNDQIPVIMCHSYPLLDRFIGLGDFERGATLHASLGSLINLYLEGVKMSIFPPTRIDPSAIENWDDFKDGIGPGAIWLMKKENFDGVSPVSVNPSGIQSFQSTYQFLKAAVLTLTNTTDASVSQATDPGFGKTPVALKMQAMNQGMQTQFDRRMLEVSTEKIFDRMIDIMAKRQEKPMPLYLKKVDLDRVAEVAQDVVEMFEVGDMGKVTFKPQHINNCDYRYEIDQGSTLKKDEVLENEALKDITVFILKNVPGAAQSLTNDGVVRIGTKKFDLGEAIKRITISSGVTDWDKIVTDDPEAQAGQAGVPGGEDQNALNLENPAISQTVNQTFNPSQPQASPQQSVTPTASDFKDERVAQVFQELQSLGQQQS